MLLLSENEYHEVKGKGGHSYILCERMGMFPNIHKELFSGKVIAVRCASTEASAKEWLRLFEEKTKASFSVMTTGSARSMNPWVLCYKRLVCQHYARRKPGKTCKASPRDTGCPVTLDIRVRKVTFQKNAKSRSKKPDAGYALQVKARGQHNHPLETATVLKFRRVSDRTRERIVELFRHHHSPATALRTLKLQLQAEHGERYPLIAADRGILPDTNYFYKLHKKFLASECGEQRTAGSVDQQPSAGSVDQQPTVGSVDQQPSAVPDDGDDTAYHDEGDDTAYHDGDDTAYHDGEMEETDGDVEPSASLSGPDDHLQTMRDEIKARLDSFTRRVLKSAVTSDEVEDWHRAVVAFDTKFSKMSKAARKLAFYNFGASPGGGRSGTRTAGKPTSTAGRTSAAEPECVPAGQWAAVNTSTLAQRVVAEPQSLSTVWIQIADFETMEQ